MTNLSYLHRQFFSAGSAIVSNLSGYVFSAFLLFFAGIYCMVYNIQSALVNFEYVLGSMRFVFLVIVPILTMCVLAEEGWQKTDQQEHRHRSGKRRDHLLDRPGRRRG